MTTRKIDPVKYLQRDDKWYLGGGSRLVWAPPFPLWLSYPGFWDVAHYYNLAIEPVFTWTLLDEDGLEIVPRLRRRMWSPSRLEQIYLSSRKQEGHGRVEIVESKFCAPNDVLTAELELRNRSRKRRHLDLIAWTVQPSHPGKTTWLTDIKDEHRLLSFTKHLQTDTMPHFAMNCCLGMSRVISSSSINLSEGSVMHPRWDMTPWFETFRHKLPGAYLPKEVGADGLVYMAIHTRIILQPSADCRASIFFSASSSPAEVESNIHLLSRQEEPASFSAENWSDHFSSVPYFQCSDERFTRYYWYRWYGLKLNTISGEEGNYRHPTTCEGIGYFRAPIAYSAPCHVLENRWMHDPAIARGNLLTFLDNRREDGGFYGYIDPHYHRPNMFYHSHWGAALREFSAIHFDAGFLKSIYDGFKEYVMYFDRERDREKSNLYDIQNHYETGQEYMHRYMAANTDADLANWGNVFRLKGVDVTTYMYELKRALSWIAKVVLRDGKEAALWNEGATKIGKAILSNMWNQDAGMFFDINPQTAQQTFVKAATCFYPYLTDLVSEEHLDGLIKHLFDPREFWTPYPIPSSSQDDEYFSAIPEWKGKRMNCPWNGRVWPMTNSHMAEAVAHTAVRFSNQDLRTRAVELISKYVNMMFTDKDPQRPNSFEHYNPMDGTPSIYRGIDDYQHSWVVDLIIKYVAGVRPEYDRIVIDPFPFHFSSVILENAHIRGHSLRVECGRRKYNIWLDGKPSGEGLIGNPLIIPL